MDRLILTDDVLLQPLLQLGQALVLTFLDLAGGDLGPQLDDVGQMLQRQGGGVGAASSCPFSCSSRSSWLRMAASRA